MKVHERFWIILNYWELRIRWRCNFMELSGVVPFYFLCAEKVLFRRPGEEEG